MWRYPQICAVVWFHKHLVCKVGSAPDRVLKRRGPTAPWCSMHPSKRRGPCACTAWPLAQPCICHGVCPSAWGKLGLATRGASAVCSRCRRTPGRCSHLRWWHLLKEWFFNFSVQLPVCICLSLLASALACFLRVEEVAVCVMSVSASCGGSTK